MDTTTIAIINGIVTGIISGLVASFIFWYIINHYISPRLIFSNNIVITKSTVNDGYEYKLIVKNISRKRAATDLRFHASIYYPNFPKKGIINHYSIPVNDSHWTEILPPRSHKTVRRIIKLNLNALEFCESHQNRIFPEKIKDDAREGVLKLEQLLEVCEGVLVRVYVAATDEYSGSRKTFTKEYNLENIISEK